MRRRGEYQVLLGLLGAVVWSLAGTGVSAAGTALFPVTADWWIENDFPDGFGRALAAGDFNGDGLCDVAVGNYIDTGFIGEAYVFLANERVGALPRCRILRHGASMGRRRIRPIG